MPTFEEIIGIKLRGKFPYSVLSNLPIFRPDLGETRQIGFEIDHLVHVREGDVDRLFIIECKGQPVRGPDNRAPEKGGPWFVVYDGQSKDARKQVVEHAKAITHFLSDGLKPQRQLTVEACVVSNDPNTRYLTDRLSPHLGLHLCSEDFLFRQLGGYSLLRVQQSPLLSELKIALRDRDVGHPPVPDAIRYVKRTRSVLDANLYRTYSPCQQLWAINGTAGMGKTVQLAYALCVLASDHEVAPPENHDIAFEKRLISHEAKARRLGFPKHQDRVIYAVALKEKQKDVLCSFYERFIREFSSLADSPTFRIVPPVFKHWDGTLPEDCNVLVIDEAHDLDEPSQSTVANWLNDSDDERPRYLGIACDRHQKLRLIGKNAPLIKGLNFSGHTTRLTRNYRNPFAVFAASLSLMFRWFTAKGPMVLPTREEIESSFGLRIGTYSLDAGTPAVFGLRNDSHPANHWLYTVSKLTSALDAHQQLSALRLPQKDILWVRFGPEAPHFDYELLSAFTYHNCHTTEAVELVDKYIKGQEFPFVVIEGLPAALVEWERSPSGGTDISDREADMWRARRLLYLCASRSTSFLYFVMGEHLALPLTLTDELKALTDCLEKPSDITANQANNWQISFTTGSIRRTPDVFDESAQIEIETEEGLRTLRYHSPAQLTVVVLARDLGVTEAKMIEFLMGEGLNMGAYSLIPVDVAREIALRHGVRVEVGVEQIITMNSETPPRTVAVDLRETIKFPSAPSRRDLAKALGLQTSELFPEATNVLTVVEADEAVTIAERYGRRLEISGGSGESLQTRVAPSAANAAQLSKPEEVDLWRLLRDRAWADVKPAGKYLELLKRLLLIDGKAREAMLTFPVGRHRVQFALSLQEIEKSGSSTKPQPIGAKGVYALTNLSTGTKQDNVDYLLRELKYSLNFRTEVRAWLGRDGNRRSIAGPRIVSISLDDLL